MFLFLITLPCCTFLLLPCFAGAIIGAFLVRSRSHSALFSLGFVLRALVKQTKHWSVFLFFLVIVGVICIVIGSTGGASDSGGGSRVVVIILARLAVFDVGYIEVTLAAAVFPVATAFI